jgi:hypothetical protein
MQINLSRINKQKRGAQPFDVRPKSRGVPVALYQSLQTLNLLNAVKRCSLLLERPENVTATPCEIRAHLSPAPMGVM